MQPATVCCSQLRLSQSTHTPDLQRMAPQFEVLVADFSRGLTRACGVHDAEAAKERLSQVIDAAREMSLAQARDGINHQ